MDGRRSRWRSLGEWVVAAALMAGAVFVALNLSGQLQRVATVTPSTTVEAAGETPTPPPAVPARAVSVPLLPLSGNARIQVGEFAVDALARMSHLVQAGADIVERRAHGERITREFHHAGGRFFLVIESNAGTEPRVTGIFIP